MKQLITITLCFIVLFSLLITSKAVSQLADSPWPMYGHDERHTFSSPYKGPDSVRVAWIFESEDDIRSAPVIGAYGGPGVFTAVKELSDKEKLIPEHYYLSQNYPNPFNPETTIEYQLPKPSKVSLKILIDGKQKAGHQSINWDGRNNFGRDVASGIYTYHLKTDEFVKSRKMILIR